MSEEKTEYSFPDSEQVEGKEEGHEEGGVEIEVIDDTPEEDRGRKPASRPIEDPTDEELEDHSKGVQKRIRELTRARHDERRRAEKLARENEELLRYLQATQQQSSQMQEYINVGQKAFIEKSKQAAQYALDSAKNRLKEAYENGDAEGIAQAQAELTSAQLQLREAESYRAQPLPQRQQPVYNRRQAVREPARQQSQIDDVTADWVAENPWFQSEGNEDMTGYAMGVHAKLERERGAGYAGTPEYFKEIDSAMRKAFPDRFKDSSAQTNEAPAAKKPSQVVAPAQRSTKPRKIRLTKTQVEIANRLGVPLEKYAKQVAALESTNE